MDYQDALALQLLEKFEQKLEGALGKEEQNGEEEAEDAPGCMPMWWYEIWESSAFTRFMNDISVVAFFVIFGTIFFQLQEKEPDGSPITFLDAFYLTIMSVTTVGFGDYSPKSEEGRIVCVFWILFSVVAVSKASP